MTTDKVIEVKVLEGTSTGQVARRKSIPKINQVQPLEVEKIAHTNKHDEPYYSLLRKKGDEDDSFLVSFLSYVSIFSGAFFSLAFGSLLTLFPIHNVMFEPQYWYEDQIVRVCACSPFMAQNLFGIEYWTDVRFKKRYLTYFLMGLQCWLIYPLVIIGFYLIWGVAMQYFPPLPMCQHLGGSIIVVAMNASLWFRLEKPYKDKKRYAWIIFGGFFQAIMLSLYGVMGSLFVNIPNDFQWVLAFLMPLCREFHMFASLSISCNANINGKDAEKLDSVKCPINAYVSTKYAVFMAIIVGGVANSFTGYLILGLDFAEQMFNGFNIIWKFKKHSKNVEDEIKDLMIGEKCTLIPLIYLLLIFMAYYGPNAELLGNIKLSIWQFQNPIQDIGPYATKVIILLAVDWTASIINIVVIRIICKINVFKVLKTLQQNFWHVFAASESFLLMEVFLQLCIGGGYDMTMEFDWKDGRYAKAYAMGYPLNASMPIIDESTLQMIANQTRV